MINVRKNKKLTKHIKHYLFNELAKSSRDFRGKLKTVNGVPSFKFSFVEPIKLPNGVWCIAGCTYAQVITYHNTYTGKKRKVSTMDFTKIELQDNYGETIKLCANELNNIKEILEYTTKIV